MKKYEEVQFVLKGNIDHLISLEGVHAVGIGYSTEKEHTDELSIHVYIESEKAANNLLQSGNYHTNRNRSYFFKYFTTL